MIKYTNTFLHHVARYFFEKHGSDFEKVWLVFPNRRAGVFFRKHLVSFYNKPVFSPKIMTISEFYQELTDFRAMDRLSLIFELYEDYLKITGKDEKFDEFYFWGEMILNDFNDIDKSGVDAKDLFRNIVDIKEIDDHFGYMSDEQIDHIKQFWSGFSNKEMSDFRTEFKRVWKGLYPLYESFRQRLIENKTGYDGLILSKLVDNLKANAETDNKFDKVYFIGHNALQNKEKEFLNILKNRDKVKFFWDYDNYYIDSSFHEAGRLMKENIKLFPPPGDFPGVQSSGIVPDIYNSILGKKNNIKLYPVNSNTGQAKLISSILNELPEDDINSPEKNAIILPDERLLVPLLNSIPEHYKNVNITMGYPAVSSVTYSLIEDLIELQLSRRSSGGKVNYYYKPVVSILNHQLISLVSENENSEILDQILKKNKIRVDKDFINSGSEINKSLFASIEFGNQMPSYLRDSLSDISRILGKLPDKANLPVLEQEVIYNLYLILNRLDELFQKRDIEFDIKTFYRFFKQAAWDISIPFSGEPLSGLQIMGILETRALDFSNIIIPSMNEGVFPKSSRSHSFIPYNLRKGFGLPLIDHQDSIYAYYFYRLLQRAENVHLIYNSQVSNVNGEMSRYLSQLTYDQDIDVDVVNYSENIRVEQNEDNYIKKDDKILSKLLSYTNKDPESNNQLSPSALISYLTCSLKFYYRYICKIYPPDTLDEEVTPMVFGNILHKTMQLLYEENVGKLLNISDVEKLLSDKNLIDLTIRKAFATEYFREENISSGDIVGRNILVFEIIRKNIIQILKFDKTLIPFSIEEMEEKYIKSVRIKIDGKDLEVPIKGYIDRVEKSEGKVIVIDYKTGSDDRNITSFDKIFDRGQKNKTKAVFQVFLYAWLLEGDKYNSEDIDFGLVITKNLFQKDFSRNISISKKDISYTDFSKEFEEGLFGLIDEIFDRDIPFTTTTNDKHCEYCDYKYMCGKQ